MMSPLRPRVAVCLAALGLAAPAATTTVTWVQAEGSASQAPRLLVLLVVDQMRADYVDRYGHQWQHGLRRLIHEGATFPLAAFTYYNTVTCAGHATIATGSLPATHGMVLNRWWNHDLGRRIGCTEDLSARTIAYGRGRDAGQSPASLRVPTLADELRAQLPVAPRIVSLSLKHRSAITMAGQRADAVLWFNGGWLTSSAFTDTPVPFVEEFLHDNPVERDVGRSWDRARPASEYLFPELAAGRRPPQPWTSSALPHRLEGYDDNGDMFYHLWENSPFADDYLARLAVAGVERLDMGRGPGTDYLAIGFSVLDLIGHKFGPASHEVQDVLIRLDRTIGMLLSELDRLVGSDHYVVALTADHGSAPIPEAAASHGLDAGRYRPVDVVRNVNAALEPMLGEGTHAVAMEYTDFYFAEGVYDRLKSQPEALEAAIEAIRSTRGVAKVFRSEELRAGRYGDDPLAASAARSHYPGRSGDLIVLQHPYWITSTDATTHGTGYGYDTRVPLVLWGAGIRTGTHLVPASPVDIAPTLAQLVGITLPSPDGRTLAEALTAGGRDRDETVAPETLQLVE